MLNKKNILIVIPTLTLGGGAEKVAVDVGDYLADFHNVSYYTFHKDDLKYPHKGGYYSLNQKKNSPFLKICMLPINVFLLYRFCKKNRIDTIISHMERANFTSILANIFLSNTQQISIVHSSGYSLQVFNKILIMFLYKYSNNVVCVSKGIQRMLIEKFKLKNTQTIHNSLDIKKIQKLLKANIETQDQDVFDSSKYTYINIGKLRDAKAQDRLIDAYYKVYLQDKDTQLLILGEGDYREYLEEKTIKLGVQSHVKLIGIRENIFPYLKASDCFVFSSRWEGFGIVLAEALASGLPIISTDCDYGPREIISPDTNHGEIISYPHVGKYGVLESNNDFDAESFAESMIDVKKGKYNFEREGFKKFDREHILPKWKKIIGQKDL